MESLWHKTNCSPFSVTDFHALKKNLIHVCFENMRFLSRTVAWKAPCDTYSLISLWKKNGAGAEKPLLLGMYLTWHSLLFFFLMCMLADSLWSCHLFVLNCFAMLIQSSCKLSSARPVLANWWTGETTIYIYQKIEQRESLIMVSSYIILHISSEYYFFNSCSESLYFFNK